jgi:hypothetical protein
MIPEKVKQSRRIALELFETYKNIVPLTTKGLPYKKTPKSRLIIFYGGKFQLVCRLNKKQMEADIERGIVLGKIKDFSPEGLKPKDWDRLHDAILQKLMHS